MSSEFSVNRSADKVRLVIATRDDQGQTVFSSDEEISMMSLPGVGKLAQLWPAGDSRTASAVRTQFFITEFPPNHLVKGSEEGGMRFSEDGMHITDSIDLDVVIEGEVVLCIPGGKELTLRQGDVVILNRAEHAWRNESDRPARLAFTIMTNE